MMQETTRKVLGPEVPRVAGQVPWRANAGP